MTVVMIFAIFLFATAISGYLLLPVLQLAVHGLLAIQRRFAAVDRT